jgi:hypothetical protein
MRETDMERTKKDVMTCRIGPARLPSVVALDLSTDREDPHQYDPLAPRGSREDLRDSRAWLPWARRVFCGLSLSLLALLGGTAQAERLTPHAWEAMPAESIGVPQIRATARAEWDGHKVVAIYGMLALGDLVSTEICLRDPEKFESNPLPGMHTTTGRVAWASVGVAGLTLLDRWLATKDPKLSWALRGIIAVIESVCIATNLHPHSTFRWPGFRDRP